MEQWWSPNKENVTSKQTHCWNHMALRDFCDEHEFKIHKGIRKEIKKIKLRVAKKLIPAFLKQSLLFRLWFICHFLLPWSASSASSANFQVSSTSSFSWVYMSIFGDYAHIVDIGRAQYFGWLNEISSWRFRHFNIWFLVVVTVGEDCEAFQKESLAEGSVGRVFLSW